MYKILKNDGPMELSLMAGIDPNSEGLMRAREMGIEASHEGINDILADSDIKIVFDATSAKAHIQAAEKLRAENKMAIDLTPAAVGPYLVPPVNLNDHIESKNINMVSCAGQATTPLVHAVSREVPVQYAETIATVASRAIGTGTRKNVDEFTRTTANSLVKVGGSISARAVPVFNPAEPPITMVNTIYTVIKEKDFDVDAVKKSIKDMVKNVSEYVPGYRLKAEPIIDYRETPWGRLPVVVIMNEVEGEGDFFPKYAGNLDIMTASARKVGELYASHILQKEEVQQ